MELRKHAKCDICGEKIGSTGVPLFFVVKVDEYMIDMVKVQKQTALSTMMGNSIVANIMGVDDEMASVVKSKEITVCSNCSIDNIAILDIVEIM